MQLIVGVCNCHRCVCICLCLPLCTVVWGRLLYSQSFH